ncbi:MAG: hypothetical protein IKU07_01265 [Oscillospiraceae bacterium]|nr:hypothetical protein [Oscillospiraceae bacterium]
MFGYVMADLRELDKATRERYGSVYCGICRQIRERTSQAARLGLSYDMAFLALLLMSLYEPEETGGKMLCCLHPVSKRPWVDNPYIRYAADMNVALAYYNAADDYRDEKKLTARWLQSVFGKNLSRLQADYPRQCGAIERCLEKLSALEAAGCDNPDAPAGCFGELMGEILVYREDMWSDTLRQLGMALGRYIYLADAAVDYRRDVRKKQYNPFVAMGTGEDPARWEQYLVLAMARCADYFERLPLVQDKKLLDNILYSGVWLEYRRRQRIKLEEENGGRSL